MPAGWTSLSPENLEMEVFLMWSHASYSHILWVLLYSHCIYCLWILSTVSLFIFKILILIQVVKLSCHISMLEILVLENGTAHKTQSDCCVDIWLLFLLLWLFVFNWNKSKSPTMIYMALKTWPYVLFLIHFLCISSPFLLNSSHTGLLSFSNRCTWGPLHLLLPLLGTRLSPIFTCETLR